MTGAPSEDLDQPGHPLSLIPALTVHIKKSCDLDKCTTKLAKLAI